MSTEIEVVKEKLSGMSKMVLETKVTNDEEASAVSDKIKNVKKLAKYIKDLKDELVAPAKEIIERAKEMYDNPLKQCINAEEALKAKARVYLEDKEAARIKAEKKIEDDLASGKIKKVETAVKKLENLPDQQKSVSGETSGLRMQKRKVVEITNPELVPEKYWVINETLLKKECMEIVNQGFPPIAGTIIKEVSTMVSN